MKEFLMQARYYAIWCIAEKLLDHDLLDLQEYYLLLENLTQRYLPNPQQEIEKQTSKG